MPRSLLDNPETIFTLPGSEQILLCDAREIFRVVLPFDSGSLPCYCYRFANRSWRRSLRFPAALRIKRIAEILSRNGIPTLEVLAALKPSNQRLDWDSFLIAGEIPSVWELPSRGRHVYRVHRAVKMSTSICIQFAHSLARFHEIGFFHGDLKSRHILVQFSQDSAAKFYFVDLEKCRHLPRIPSIIGDFFRARDLIQLLSSIHIPSDSEMLVESFLQSYFEISGISYRRRRMMERILSLYGPQGAFLQGRTILHNISQSIEKW